MPKEETPAEEQKQEEQEQEQKQEQEQAEGMPSHVRDRYVVK